MTHDQAIKILENHGMTATQQASAFNGILVKKGSSFYEKLGHKETYTKKEIFDWLGY